MHVRRIVALAAAAAAALAVGLAGCASTDAPAGTPTGAATAAATPADDLSGTLTVSAAASLQNAFDDIIASFEKQHPAVDVHASYDGSSTLATQILAGAPVDVFASADEATMSRVTDAGLASDPTVFAHNTLVIAVPEDNPAHIRSLADLARSGVTVVLCAPQVPCGAASRTLLKNAGVKVTPVSDEQNVTAVLTKVANGEADAGLVYTTDAKGANVHAIVPDGADKVVNTYPIVALSKAPNAAAAKAFVAAVTSPVGQEALASYGFAKP